MAGNMMHFHIPEARMVGMYAGNLRKNNKIKLLQRLLKSQNNKINSLLSTARKNLKLGIMSRITKRNANIIEALRRKYPNR
jgi:hypothetical protein